MAGFDDSKLMWSRLGEEAIFDYLLVHALYVDESSNRVAFLGKFEPNEMIVLHKHLGDTDTFVVDGEHVLYEPDSREVRDRRPTGRHTASEAGDVHREGGGAQGAIVHYSVSADSDALFDILDDDHNVVLTLRTGDVKALIAQQEAAGA